MVLTGRVEKEDGEEKDFLRCLAIEHMSIGWVWAAVEKVGVRVLGMGADGMGAMDSVGKMGKVESNVVSVVVVSAEDTMISGEVV